jgi:anti-sigma regulatory factor (Ser/Thr protein kinase)
VSRSLLGPSHADYRHEAVYYDSTPQLVESTAPLLERALAHGEDVALVCTEAATGALREALNDHSRILVLPRPEIFRKAVTAVGCLRDLVEERLANGGRRVCVLGEVDFGAGDRALDESRRYEALLNVALRPFPLWSLCGYNTGVLPERVLASGELTHPYLRRDGMPASTPTILDPFEVMRLADANGAPVPDDSPAVSVADVHDLGALRRDIGLPLLAEGVSGEQVDDLAVAVHELATNGLRHGEPPVTVRVWLTPGRVVCTITDRGAGFDDPFTGYVRGAGGELPEGQFGLWLARQLCDEVVPYRTQEGFTVRLTMRH